MLPDRQNPQRNKRQAARLPCVSRETDDRRWGVVGYVVVR